MRTAARATPTRRAANRSRATSTSATRSTSSPSSVCRRGPAAGGLVVGAERNAVRLPPYARLDLRANRAFNYRRSRLTLFAEVVNVLNRTNYALDYGTVFANGQAIDFKTTQLPLLPSAGILVEF